MTESKTLRAILVTYGALPNVRLFRNSGGVAKDRRGNVVRFGLCVGASDIIGWKAERVIPYSDTYLVARFVALEVKSASGRLTPEQAAFLEAVRHAGGIAACVRSVEEAGKALGIDHDDAGRGGEGLRCPGMEADPDPRRNEGADPQGLA
jgi:hypothetical protein